MFYDMYLQNGLFTASYEYVPLCEYMYGTCVSTVKGQLMPLFSIVIKYHKYIMHWKSCHECETFC